MSFSRTAAASIARPVVRRSVAAPARFATRANSTVSTSGSSHAGGKHGGDPKSSDLPWIIGSTIFFGSAFFYVTSPVSKTHNEHGHVTGAKTPSSHGPGSSRSDDKTGDDAVWKQEDHDGTVEEEAAPEEDAPAGDKHLHHNTQRGTPEMQKTPRDHKDRDPSNTTVGIENSNFKHGVAAAFDGNPISDPKAVVAKAHTDKQARRAEKMDASISKTDPQSEDDEKEVEESGSKGDEQ